MSFDTGLLGALSQGFSEQFATFITFAIPRLGQRARRMVVSPT
jgi:hypothetical protein